ncbi:MAG: TonB-dependent receptor [Sphingomonadales bacterium]|nr:MAG: TonB-dependent receptor [Sphingomonadales bacterium]
MLASAPAFAQEQEAVLEQIVVTGSRIARPDLSATSPVTVVTAEQFKLSGTVNVEQLINTLPQVIPSTTAFSNNPGGGVATIDLRDLGTTRTLILVNDRRYLFFDANQVVDVNTIPGFLVGSVDVVTGGASAVYGSDALSGVVNFRLRTDLDGVELGSQYDITSRGDGARWNAYAAFGTQFADNRGHITGYAEYYRRRAIFQGARGFSRFALGDDGTGGFIPGGSPTVPEGRIQIATSSTVAAGNGLDAVTLPRAVGVFRNNAGLGLGGAIFNADGSARAYAGSEDNYNYAPDNYLQVPQERWSLGAYGEYEIASYATAYFEAQFTNNRVDNELAPTPVGFGTLANVRVPLTFADGQTPYFTPADLTTLNQIDANEALIDRARIARGQAVAFDSVDTDGDGLVDADGTVRLNANRRVNEISSRRSLDERNAYRVVIGLKGDITDKWKYDSYYFYARTRNANIQEGNISQSAIISGIESGDVDIFGPGSLNDSAVEAISILAQNNDISELQVAQGSVSGTLFSLGLGADEIGLAFGGEWRRVSGRFIPDTALSSGDVVGFNAGDPTQGSYSVGEAFGEVRVPIVKDAPFFYNLEVNAAARYSDYTLDAVGGVVSWAAGATWAPVKDISFRAQYQKATRAPNVQELFGGTAQGFPPATDPCSAGGSDQSAAVRAVCEATGVPAANVFTAGLQQATQIEGLFGGNPNLEEETSDTYTVGAVIRPRWIPGLNIKVDYYNIQLDNAISVLGGSVQGVLDLCYLTVQDANSAVCQAVRRDANGEISGGNFTVLAGNANIASVKTSGIDLEADYSTAIPFGFFGDESRLTLNWVGSYTLKYDQTPLVDAPSEQDICASRFGQTCGEPKPNLRFTSRATWKDGPLTTSIRWRYIGGVDDDSILGAGADPETLSPARVQAAHYFDLTFGYEVNENAELSVGMRNIFDRKPTLIGDSQEQANTYPSTYDVLGRDFFVSAKLKF